MFIVYSVLDGLGKAERHYRTSGDNARIVVASMERLSGKPLTAPTYHEQAHCWISEFSRVDCLTNAKGDTEFLERVEVA